MSTYLQLVQQVARDSGTVSGDGQPPTLVGITGRLAKMASWTNEAWRNIQNHRSAWRWMQGEFAGQTVAAQQRYTAAQLGIASRFAEWTIRDHDDISWSSYRTATGQSDEGALHFLDWSDFRVSQLRGTQVQGRPRFFSIDNENRVVLSPTPDAAFTIKGLYRKGVQDLVANGDIPELPERFHDLIKWKALELVGVNDENAPQLGPWILNGRRIMSELERDQLPRIRLCGPLA